MPGSQLAIFQSGAMPAHIQELNEAHRNIVVRATGNSLTFEGKIWAITLDGKKTKLMKTGDDGEEAPVQVFNCVLLGYNPFRGRMYYQGAYDPKKPKAPDCWSDDSVKPNADVTHKMAKTCAECAMSKKGSSVTDDGKQTVACSQFQKLAVVPLAKLGEFPVLRLNIKITSIWDKEGAETHPNWFAFDQYMQALTAGGIHNTSVIPTKIKFDINAAYPKLLFSTGQNYFDAETAKLTNEMAQSEEVKNLLAETFHPTATTGTAELPEEDAEAAGPAPATPAQAGPKRTATNGKAPAAKVTPPVEEPEEQVTLPETPAAPEEDEDERIAREAQERIAAKKAAAAKPPVTLDENGDEVVLTAEQRAAATRAANATKTATAAAQAAAKAASKPKPAIPDDDETGDPPAAPAKAAAAKAPAANGKAPTAPKAPAAAPANIAALMGEWDA